MINHPIEPVYAPDSRVLILGSFPSEASRREMFFYGHPRNRFWKVLSDVFERDEPVTTEGKRELLLKEKVALWDVIASCDIQGSSDGSIKNVVVNDISEILSHANIESIFVNGKTALKYYNRFIRDKVGREAVCLPSTSPANASWSFERLRKEWSRIKT